MKLLLDKGAAVDKALKDGHIALIIAAQKGHAAVAKVLLDKGGLYARYWERQSGGFLNLVEAAE